MKKILVITTALFSFSSIAAPASAQGQQRQVVLADTVPQQPTWAQQHAPSPAQAEMAPDWQTICQPTAAGGQICSGHNARPDTLTTVIGVAGAVTDIIYATRRYGGYYGRSGGAGYNGPIRGGSAPSQQCGYYC
ncbi:MAG: hypothetical protein AAB472_00025 [Patescibacteria group bacterium]